MREEIAHIIEVTVATVEELTTISQVAQYATHRQITHAVFATLDDTLASAWRNTER